ncbi:hypothetical protein ACPV5O_07450 [Vibrio maritimus]|uniref:hypothetical protein n=1 Tax=Vibrio maritimus TaxID=990268 RepID=UPI004068F2AA
MKPKASQIVNLAKKLELACQSKDFESIAKWNRMLKRILNAIDQQSEQYREAVLQVKKAHLKCVSLVNQEQGVLKQQIEHNLSFKMRDKAYAQTQVRAKES